MGTSPTISNRVAIAAMLLAGAATLLPGASLAAGDKAAIAPWGVDLKAIDPSIDPGDDFFRYVNGNWLRTAEIPADRARWGSFDILIEKSENDTLGVVEAAVAASAAGSAAPGTVERKVADYYRSYVDTAAIERLGLAPARDALSAIQRIRTHEDFARLVSGPSFRANSPVSLFVALDAKRPDTYVVYLSQGGLGMPDRDFYLKADARSLETKASYRKYVETMMRMSAERGDGPTGDAAAAADAILAFETKIAGLHWPRDKVRNRDLSYNPKSRAELKALAPGYPWDAALASFGAPAQDLFIVSQPDAVQGLAALFRETPVATLRAYVTFHYLNGIADVLPKAFDDASFDFNQRVINGVAQQRERRKRALTAMSGRPFLAPMGEALGQLYVARHFRPEAKAAVAKLVENLRAAYRTRIQRLPWMTEATKVAALKKLETLGVKIGYTDKWRDYSALEISAGDAFGNRVREQAFNRKRDIERLGRRADRGEWAMGPQIVNAYYNPPWNEVVFPAAVLQAPFFDANADDAVNYGGIGSVIGHEMGHGFDDQGAKSDENGVLRNWWGARDEENFKALGTRLADQYSKFEALPGLFVNGRLTLGENLGDLGGLNVALEAYRISLGGKEPPVLDGFTGVQRFYLSFGQLWRSSMRDAAMRTRVMSDTHSPAEFRANGTVRNMDEWYAAFGVKPTAKLYLAPDQRVRVW